MFEKDVTPKIDLLLVAAIVEEQLISARMSLFLDYYHVLAVLESSTIAKDA